MRARWALVVLVFIVVLAGCKPTPEPTRLVAEPPTATPASNAAVTATPPVASAAQPTVAGQPYPAPEAVVDGPYPGPAAAPAESAPSPSPTRPPVPLAIVPTPAADHATVTGVIMLRAADGTTSPLQYARVFLARRLRDEAGQPSFMVSLSKSNAPTSITDGEGRFAFGAVTPEHYALIIEFGQQLALARDVSSSEDVLLVAEAGQITDIGEIVVTLQ